MLNTEIQRLIWDDLCSALVLVGIYQFHQQSLRRLVFFPDRWLSVSGIFSCRSRDSMMSSPHPLSLLGVAVSWSFYAGRLSFLPFNTGGGVRNRARPSANNNHDWASKDDLRRLALIVRKSFIKRNSWGATPSGCTQNTCSNSRASEQKGRCAHFLFEFWRILKNRVD